MNTIRARLAALPRTPTLAMIWLLCMGLAVATRFVQDDAYISFRYARHLAEGRGLVFNVGEQVEGYTNFLWTVLLAGWHLAGVDLALASVLMGLICHGITLALTARLATRLAPAEAAAPWHLGAVTMFLWGTCYTAAAYATGGLATPMQTMWFVVGLSLVESLWSGAEEGGVSVAQLIGFGLVLALAQLTRPDSGLFVVVCAGGWVLGGVLGARTLRLWHVAIPALLSAAIVAAWLIWKHDLYGSLLPNTYYAKRSTETSSTIGSIFLIRFFVGYLFVVAAPLLWLGRARRPVVPPLLRMSWLLVALWCAYIVHVGGDFMEFRFMAPVLPLIFLGLVHALWQCQPDVRRRALVIGVLCAGSLWHALAFTGQDYGRRLPMISSVAKLRRHAEDHLRIGAAIGDAIAHDASVVISARAIGGVAYNSRATMIDMHGLTDAWIARHGELDPYRAIGHQRLTPLSYLLRRRVHLWAGQLDLLADDKLGSPVQHRYLDAVLSIFAPECASLPDTTRVLIVPLGRGQHTTLVQLYAHPSVDAAIRRGGWTVIPVDLKTCKIIPPASSAPTQGL